MSATKWCTGCGQELSILKFAPDRRGGYQRRCKACQRNRRAIEKHGLTRLDKERMAAEQGGCLTCHITEPGAKGWVVDHDRTCCPGDKSCEKCRRGILCQWCNSALGYACDNPDVLRALADYLESGQRLGLASRSSESVEGQP